MANYAGQVMGNYQEGLSGTAAWFGNIDYFDLGIAAAIGGLTGGYGATPIVTSSLGKASIIVGGSLLQGAIDITGKKEFRIVGVNKSFNEFTLDASVSLISNYSHHMFMKQFPKAAKIGSAKYFVGAIDFMFGALNNTVSEYGRNEIYYDNKELFPFDDEPIPNENLRPLKRNHYGW